MNEPMLTISGNVATDIRHAVTDTGVTIASFRLAATPRRYDRGAKAWGDMETMYFGVTAWRFLGENVLGSIRKGDPVVVTGRLRQRTWEKEGRTGVNLEITAEAVGHDLNRGTSRFAKVTRTRVVPPEERPEVRAELGIDGPLEEDLRAAEWLAEPQSAESRPAVFRPDESRPAESHPAEAGGFGAPGQQHEAA
jgi:single-stranded DNA-binding protein